jgi:hypothetical protein
MRFYVEHLPPGKAEGADDWNDYSNYEEQNVDEEFDELEVEFDEVDDEPQPLDYYFPRRGK